MATLEPRVKKVKTEPVDGPTTSAPPKEKPKRKRAPKKPVEKKETLRAQQEESLRLQIERQRDANNNFKTLVGAKPAVNSKYYTQQKEMEKVMDGLKEEMSGNAMLLAKTMYNTPSLAETHTFGVNTPKPKFPEPITSPEQIEQARRNIRQSERVALGTNELTEESESSIGNPTKFDSFYHALGANERTILDNSEFTQQMLGNEEQYTKYQNLVSGIQNVLRKNVSEKEDTRIRSCPRVKREYIIKHLRGCTDNADTRCHNNEKCVFWALTRKLGHSNARPGVAFRLFPHDPEDLAVPVKREIPMPQRVRCVLCQMVWTYEYILFCQQHHITTKEMIQPFQVMVCDGEFAHETVFSNLDIPFPFPKYAEHQFELMRAADGGLDDVPQLRPLWPNFR